MIIDRLRLRDTIVRLRKDAGLSQHQLAERARISRSSLANVEAGYCVPSLPTAVAIADTLCITVDDLIEEAR